jgi:uncharacterized protein YgbK (DUF1537 family)
MKEQNLSIDILKNNEVPDELALPLLNEIKSLCKSGKIKIIVLDDDPTGTQTIHDLPVITLWNEDLIEEMMNDNCPGFFILTNTRSMTEKKAIAVNEEIARNVKIVGEKLGYIPLLISRGDSTLRGHFPAELLALEKGLGKNFDGFVFMPYFREGGRFTIGDVHYLQHDQQLIPIASTPFAKDSVFGYTSSDLKKYIREKTDNQVESSSIISIDIFSLNEGTPAVEKILDSLKSGQYAIVNGTCLYHATVLALAVIHQYQKNKPLLVRCAPSLVQAFFGISQSKQLASLETIFAEQPAYRGGLMIVGSFVPQTTAQINHLLKHIDIIPVELKVDKLFEGDPFIYLQQLSHKIKFHLQQKSSVVLFTSRDIFSSGDIDQNTEAAAKISNALVTVVKQLSIAPKFLVAKGGITSSDIATKALGVIKAKVLGQLLTGVVVWELDKNAKFPGVPYIIVPGNVGNEDCLTRIYNILNSHAAA